MIRRDIDNGWLLISQIEHARLAYDLALAWGNERTSGLPLVEWLLPAIRGHDDGWFEWEQSPRLKQDGVPMSFTEMPAGDSVEIWSRSIESCASGPPSYSEALRRLRNDGEDVAVREALALEELLRGGRRFRRESFTMELARHAEITEEIATAVVTRFERQGLIRPCGRALEQAFYEIGLVPVGEAPLAGLWVSGHFQALAHQALEHRADDAGEVEKLRRFINEQERRCAVWREAAAEFAGAELERVIDTGLRYLQLFDRISLWLCMAEREEPWEARLGEGRRFVFRPETRRIIQVAPWPFGEGALELEVTALDGERTVVLPWRLIPGEGERETLDREKT